MKAEKEKDKSTKNKVLTNEKTKSPKDISKKGKDNLLTKDFNFDNLIKKDENGKTLLFNRRNMYILGALIPLIIAIINCIYINNATSLILGLRLILATVFMEYMFFNLFKDDKDYMNIIGLICSLGYGISNYFIGQLYNAVPIDGIVLLPIIYLTFNRVIKGKKSIAFVLFMFITFLIDSRDGISISLFLILSLLFINFSQEAYNKSKVFNLIIHIILALLSGTYFIISDIGNDCIFFKYSFGELKFDYNFFDGIYSLIPSNRFIMVMAYSSLVAIILMINYFLSNKESILNRIFSIVVLGIYFTALICPNIAYFTNGFVYDDSVKSYSAYILIFMISTMAYKGFKYVYNNGYLKIIISTIIPLILVSLSTLWSTVFSKIDPLVLSIDILVLIGATLIFYKRNSLRDYGVSLVLLIITIVEISINFFIRIKYYNQSTFSFDDYKNIFNNKFNDFQYFNVWSVIGIILSTVAIIIIAIYTGAKKKVDKND